MIVKHCKNCDTDFSRAFNVCPQCYGSNYYQRSTKSGREIKVLFRMPFLIYFLAVEPETKKLCFAVKKFESKTGTYYFKIVE